MKENKGITIISLIVTIIILMILAGTTITITTNILPSSKDSKYISELNIVQHAVFEQYTKYNLLKKDELLVGYKVEESQMNQIADELGITLVQIPTNYTARDYYRLDKATLLDLGISNTEDEYIVNYTTGEVINITR